jgi:Thioredoxin-like
MKRTILILAVVLMLPYGLNANETPIEIGSVKWGHDLDKALRLSGETGRPVFLLFQEVPGCSGCQDFGRTVLSNPRVVEAIENEFLPVLVYNNRGGEDRRILERYNEPAWNYQVVRFLNAEGQDIILRKDRVWTVKHLASRMIETLQAVGRPVPDSLRALAEESPLKR